MGYVKLNDQKFLDDLKRVRDVMVHSSISETFLHVSKTEVLREAETSKIVYYMTDGIFKVKRDVMVII